MKLDVVINELEDLNNKDDVKQNTSVDWRRKQEKIANEFLKIIEQFFPRFNFKVQRVKPMNKKGIMATSREIVAPIKYQILADIDYILGPLAPLKDTAVAALNFKMLRNLNNNKREALNDMFYFVVTTPGVSLGDFIGVMINDKTIIPFINNSGLFASTDKAVSDLKLKINKYFFQKISKIK